MHQTQTELKNKHPKFDFNRQTASIESMEKLQELDSTLGLWVRLFIGSASLTPPSLF